MHPKAIKKIEPGFAIQGIYGHELWLSKVGGTCKLLLKRNDLIHFIFPKLSNNSFFLSESKDIYYSKAGLHLFFHQQKLLFPY